MADETQNIGQGQSTGGQFKSPIPGQPVQSMGISQNKSPSPVPASLPVQPVPPVPPAFHKPTISPTQPPFGGPTPSVPAILPRPFSSPQTTVTQPISPKPQQPFGGLPITPPISDKPASTVGKDPTFATRIPSKSNVVNPQPAPLYVRPTQNTTESMKPAISQEQTSKILGQLKEYKTSIRTMSDDISKIKIGQYPSGFDIQKTITPQQTPVSNVARGSVPTPSKQDSSQISSGAPKLAPTTLPGNLPFRIPNTPSPATPTFPRPVTAPPISAKVPQVLGGETVPRSGITPPLQMQVNIPQVSSNRRINPVFIAVLILILVVAGGAFWFFSSVSKVTESPTPTASVSPTPAINLEKLFDFPTEAVPIVASADSLADFISQADKITVGSAEMIKISAAGEALKIGLVDLLDRFSINYPADLKNYLGGDKIVIIYGQEEGFDDKGSPILNDRQKRFIFISEIADEIGMRNILSGWELSMSGDLAGLFNLNLGKAKENAFLSNEYQGFPLRFKNFPYPDRSIDHALVRASNGKSYFVITNSREAMFAAIDKLR